MSLNSEFDHTGQPGPPQALSPPSVAAEQVMPPTENHDQLCLKLILLTGAGAERRTDVQIRRSVSVAQFKTDRLSEEIFSGWKPRLFHLGRLLRDSDTFHNIPDGSLMHVYLQRDLNSTSSSEFARRRGDRIDTRTLYTDDLLPTSWARVLTGGRRSPPHLCTKRQNVLFNVFCAAALSVAWGYYLADPATFDGFSRFVLRFFSIAWVVSCSADVLKDMCPEAIMTDSNRSGTIVRAEHVPQNPQNATAERTSSNDSQRHAAAIGNGLAADGTSLTGAVFSSLEIPRESETSSRRFGGQSIVEWFSNRPDPVRGTVGDSDESDNLMQSGSENDAGASVKLEGCDGGLFDRDACTFGTLANFSDMDKSSNEQFPLARSRVPDPALMTCELSPPSVSKTRSVASQYLSVVYRDCCMGGQSLFRSPEASPGSLPICASSDQPTIEDEKRADIRLADGAPNAARTILPFETAGNLATSGGCKGLGARLGVTD